MKSKSGFTIVELLIVIVVIAILATISIVAYNGVQDRVHDSSIKSSLSGISKKLAMYKVDNGAYPSGATAGDVRTALQTIDITLNDESIYADRSSVLYFAEPSGKHFALLIGAESGKTFYIASTQTLSPNEYSGNGNWQTVFPGSGNASAIGAHLGLSGVTEDNRYYLHTSGSGLRIWN